MSIREIRIRMARITNEKIDIVDNGAVNERADGSADCPDGF